MGFIGDDVEALRQSGLTIEIHPAEKEHLVVIRNNAIPPGKYWQTAADILIRIPETYPQGKLNMFWADPPLVFISGQHPEATPVRNEFLGRSWQRWSRHYKWNPRQHSLVTHWAFVEQCIQEGNP